MKELKFTLIADGSSDKTLLRIIKWLLDDLYPKLPNRGVFADFRSLPNPPRTLNEKLNSARNYYPFDIVFIHRDAESINQDTIGLRMTQIEREIGLTNLTNTVCIIPIKMMETWLLIDKDAIKKAAGNRNFTGDINLPPVSRLEKENQPKKLLHDLLIESSGLKGRNLKKFNVHKSVHLVSEYITDYNKLRELNAFNVFEINLKKVVSNFMNQE